jgi:hypothetical protein
VPLEHADRAVADALCDLGVALGVDRAYVFRVDDEAGTISNTHEWCGPGIASQIDVLRSMPQRAVPQLLSELRAHRTVHLPDVSGLADRGRPSTPCSPASSSARCSWSP